MREMSVDYSRTPLLVIWEVTRACALACRHCRASAEDLRHPNELSTDEGRRLIDDVAEMGTPLIVFTGGDPLQRDDLEQLIRHACDRGLHPATIPASTERLTRERVFSLKNSGCAQMALSLDGPDASRHDDFRKVPGSFERVMEGCRWAHEAGIPLQINSVFGAWNADTFHEMAALVESLDIVFWEVFFLVPTGRGALLQSCSALQMKALFEELYALSLRVPFVVKLTEGQHYRAFLAQKLERQADLPAEEQAYIRRFLGRDPVNAGRGFCFVDHVGEVYPSGFLPEACGNVRHRSVTSIYREHPVFVELRDASRLKGACGTCRYRDLCSGGSRSRAAAANGDYLAEEPYCFLAAEAALAAGVE
jgi:AdoMet-dependent heme synthase